MISAEVGFQLHLLAQVEQLAQLVVLASEDVGLRFAGRLLGQALAQGLLDAAGPMQALAGVGVVQQIGWARADRRCSGCRATDTAERTGPVRCSLWSATIRNTASAEKNSSRVVARGPWFEEGRRAAVEGSGDTASLIG